MTLKCSFGLPLSHNQVYVRLLRKDRSVLGNSSFVIGRPYWLTNFT